VLRVLTCICDAQDRHEVGPYEEWDGIDRGQLMMPVRRARATAAERVLTSSLVSRFATWL